MKVEQKLLESQAIDKIDKRLRYLFDILVEKDFRAAQSIIDKIKEDGTDDAKQIAQGIQEVVEFMRASLAGKEMKSTYKDLSSITLLPELVDLIPYTEEEYEDLKASIIEKDIIDPLMVQEIGDELRLIDGYTRFRIAKELGKRRVPVVSVNPLADPTMLALTLNVLRRQLSKEQRVEFIKKLPMKASGRPKRGSTELSVKDVAKMKGVSERTIQRAKKEAKEGKPVRATKKKSEVFMPIASDTEFDSFFTTGYINGRSFSVDIPFPPSEKDIEEAQRYLLEAIGNCLDYVAQKGIQSKVKKFTLEWSVKIWGKDDV